MGYEMMLAQMERTHVEYTLEQEDAVSNNHTYKDEQALLDLVRRGDTASVKVAVDTMFPVYPDVIGYSNKKMRSTWRSSRWRWYPGQPWRPGSPRRRASRWRTSI